MVFAVPAAARVSAMAAVTLAEGCAYPAPERFAGARYTDVFNLELLGEG